MYSCVGRALPKASRPGLQWLKGSPHSALQSCISGWHPPAGGAFLPLYTGTCGQMAAPGMGGLCPHALPLAPGSSAFPSFTRDLPSHLCVPCLDLGSKWTDRSPPPPQDDSLPPSPHPRPPALSTPSKGSRPEHPRGFQEDALPLAPESSPTYSRPRRCSSDPDRALPHPCFSQGLFARGGPCRSPTSSECLRACP